jgi:hypothetical protein
MGVSEIRTFQPPPVMGAVFCKICLLPPIEELNGYRLEPTRGASI